VLSDELRADAEIVTAAVAKHGASCLELAAESLRADRAFISTVHAAAADPRELLSWVAPELQADRDVVIAAADSGARLEYAHATLRDDAEVLLRAMEAALVLEDARGGASVANLFRDQLESASARLRADVSFARGCLSLPSLARLTIEEPGLRDHMNSLWVHLNPKVWLDTDVLLAAAALYSPEVFPLLWPTERLQAAVSDPFVGRPAWISGSHDMIFFEHYCVHGDDASMLRGMGVSTLEPGVVWTRE